MADCQRVPTKQAAKEIGCAEQYLREQMRYGAWDLGSVIKPKRGGTNYRCYIFRSKLDKFLGREESA